MHNTSFRSPSATRNWLCSYRAEGASDGLWSLRVCMLLPCGTPRLSCIHWKVTTDTHLPQTIQWVFGCYSTEACLCIHMCRRPHQTSVFLSPNLYCLLEPVLLISCIPLWLIAVLFLPAVTCGATCHLRALLVF